MHAEAHANEKPGSYEPPTPETINDSEALKSLLVLCRNDIHAFCEFVIKDETTNEGIEQAPIHLEMQESVEPGSRTIIMAHPESGKTSQIGIARVLWELGRDPTLLIALIGNTQDSAKKTLGAIKKYIESSVEYRMVFPHVKPGAVWRDDRIEILRPTISKNPTIQCVGFHGQIVGARLDIIVVDDLLDYENTRTAYVRKDVEKWFRSSVMSRLSRRCWVAFLTNAWHREDLAHELEKTGWKALRYPVRDKMGRPTWPDRWPVERIAQAMIDMGPNDFARAFECKPRDDSTKIFPEEAIDRCLARGRGYGLVSFLDDDEIEPGSIIVHGVDVATSKRATGAVSCVFTLLVHPNGDRQPLAIRAGRYSAPQLIAAIRDATECFGGVVVVEDNGVQRFIVEVAQQADSMITVPIFPFQTGKNKVEPATGIESMSTEFDGGRWIVPSGRDGRSVDPALKEWLTELDDFDPLVHAGDRLMASWMARTWALRKMRSKRASSDDDSSVRVGVIGPNASAAYGELRNAARDFNLG